MGYHKSGERVIRTAARILKAMNSEADPGQIALALSFALVGGLTPLWSLHNLLVLFLVLVLRVNVSAFIVGLGFFSGIAYLLDPAFHRLGLWVLTAGALKDLWTALYNMVLFRLERFNNSVVMGSLVVSLALFVPIFLAARMGVVRYREHVLAWVKRSRVMQVFQGTRFYKVYRSLSDLRESL